MSYLIAGATKGLGRDLAYEFAKNSKDLIIISRNKDDLEKLKDELEKNFDIKVLIFELDLSSQNNVKNFINENNKILNTLDGALFPVGMMDNADTIKNADSNLEKLISANFLSIVYLVNKLSKIFKEKNSGAIIGFGSVSASFGRQINTIYSSAKKALESYFESLIVTNDSGNIKIQFYILGYLDTRLSLDKKLLFPKGSTKKLSRIVFNNLNKKGIKRYFPFWWLFIILIIKILPFFVVKKIIKNF